MNIYKVIATFGGAGYSPVAPGTVGAIFAMFIAYILRLYTQDQMIITYIIITLIIMSYFAGVLACNKLSSEWGSDPSRVVIDEACGYWITLLFLPLTTSNLLLALVLFRFFDIAKPLGIRKIDNMHHSSHAVMLDDVVAGIYGCAILHALNYFIINPYI
jgi:phosphatidylglycerophosphatase A